MLATASARCCRISRNRQGCQFLDEHWLHDVRGSQIPNRPFPKGHRCWCIKPSSASTFHHCGIPSDTEEPMAARGIGVIYTCTSTGDILWARPDATDRKKCLDRWYWPHHSGLERLVKDAVKRSGVCPIVDCHSFASVALPYELDQNSHRADQDAPMSKMTWTFTI
jgi:hypothetical protein